MAALDPENRGLQRVAFPTPQTGGEITIEVVEIEPGTKPDWREIAVSELQVLGRRVALQRPSTLFVTPVYVGTLDPEPIRHADCTKAIGPLVGREPITHVASIAIDAHTSLCRVEHHRDGTSIVTIELGIVDGDKLRGTRLTRTWSTTIPDAVEDGTKPGVELEAVPLEVAASGLLVSAVGFTAGPAVTTHHTLYRVTSAGLVQVLAYDSLRSPTDVPNDRICHLSVLAAGAPLHDLDVSCTTRTRGDHDEWGNAVATNIAGGDDAWYQWNGTDYERQDHPRR